MSSTKNLHACAITGWSTINSLGAFTDGGEFENFVSGSSALKNLSYFEENIRLGSCDLSLNDEKELKSYKLVNAALHLIMEKVKSVLSKYKKNKVSLILASNTVGLDASEKRLNDLFPKQSFSNEESLRDDHTLHGLLNNISKNLDMTGPSFLVSNSCSSGSKAIASGQRLITSGFVDAAIIVGVDVLTKLTIGGFRSLGLLKTGHTAPHFEVSDGMTLGEGAAILILERENKEATSYLVSTAENSDAYHLTSPDPSGKGALNCINLSLSRAQIKSSEIDYLNSHGSGTIHNDQVESMVIKKLFDDVSVSSIKGSTGHLLGCAGVLEAIQTTIAVAKNITPKQKAYPGKQYGESLNVNGPKNHIKYAMSNNFAFGGSNCSLIFSKKKNENVLSNNKVYLKAFKYWDPKISLSRLFTDNRKEIIIRDHSVISPDRIIFGKRAFQKSSLLQKLIAESILFSTKSSVVPCVPMFFGSKYGEIRQIFEILEDIQKGSNHVSPMLFQNCSHSSASGLLSIELKNKQPMHSIAAGNNTLNMLLLEAMSFLKCHGGEVIVSLADENPLTPYFSEKFEPHALGIYLSTYSDDLTHEVSIDFEDTFTENFESFSYVKNFADKLKDLKTDQSMSSTNSGFKISILPKNYKS